MSDDGVVTNELVMAFTRKSIFDHIAGVLGNWRTFALTSATAFGVWTSVEAPARMVDASFRGAAFYLGGLLASLVIAGVWTIRCYLRECPEGFENESPGARRIAHLQRTRWEYRLAGLLLTEALRDLDDELAALSEGRVFVPVESSPDYIEYIEWARLGPTNVLRMIDVARKLLILDLPAAIGLDVDASKPLAIRAVVHRIRDLYMETVAFERSRRSVQPPDGAEALHELQLGWTEPVRCGIQQMFGFFDKVLALKSIKQGEVAYIVKMDEPASVSAFSDELSRIQRTFL